MVESNTDSTELFKGRLRMRLDEEITRVETLLNQAKESPEEFGGVESIDHLTGMWWGLIKARGFVLSHEERIESIRLRQEMFG